MINIPTTMLSALSQGAASGAKVSLPWPNGSLLSAQVLQKPDAGTAMAQKPDSGTAMLQIGNFRLLAKVPTHLPQGNVWIQLLTAQYDRGDGAS